VPSSADLAALVEALLLRGLRPAGNVTRDSRPGSKSGIYRVEDRALSGCEAGVSVGSALWRFAARVPGLASGLAPPSGPLGRQRGRPGQCAAFRPGDCGLSHGDRRTRRERDGLPGSCGATSGRDGGDRLRPVPGQPCAAARRAVGLPPEGRGESCRPATARPPATLGAYHRSPGRSALPGCSRLLT
jgi:hypothetical protein